MLNFVHMTSKFDYRWKLFQKPSKSTVIYLMLTSVPLASKNLLQLRQDRNISTKPLLGINCL